MQSLPDEKHVFSTPYNIFVYSISNELTRRYYERRLRQFFDYIQFDLYSDLRERSQFNCCKRVDPDRTGSKSNHLIPAISEGQDKERGNSCSEAKNVHTL